jgi:hypothetical protein
VGWTNVTFAIPAGTNAFEWRYAKDAVGNSVGLDAAFLDNLDLPLVVAADASSAARLGGGLGAGSFQLEIDGQSGQSYVIQSSDDLRHWLPVSTNVAAGGIIRYADPLFIRRGLQFYRAVMP